MKQKYEVIAKNAILPKRILLIIRSCDDDAAVQFVAEDEDENPDPILSCFANALHMTLPNVVLTHLARGCEKTSGFEYILFL